MHISSKKKLWKSLVLAGLFSGMSLFADSTISKIELVSGNGKMFSQDSVRRMIMLQEGEPFSPARLSEDVKALQKSGCFDDVQVSAIPNDDGRVTVVYTLFPASVIREVLIEGESRISEKKIRKKIKMKSGYQFNWHYIGQDVQEIRKLYMDKEDHETTIQYQVRENEDGTVDLVYVINEKPLYKLRKVSFSGNEFFTDKQLKKKMITSPKLWLWCYLFDTGYLNPLTLGIDSGTIQRMYAEEGFYKCKIPHIEDNHYDESQTWTSVVFRIAEGQRYKFGTVDIQGNERLKAEQLQQNRIEQTPSFYAIPGEWAREEAIRRDIDFIKKCYGELGYADLEVVADKKINDDTGTVDVVYTIKENGVFTIDNITITGNKKTKNKVILRELTMHPGDLVDTWQMDRDVERLYNMNYFNKVTFVPLNSLGVDGKKDLNLQVEERSTGRAQIGAGYSIDDSASVFASWQQDNFDLFGWDSGFVGGGQSMAISGSVGDTTSSFDLTFREPWLFDRRLSLTSRLYYNVRFEDSYEQNVMGTEWSVTTPLATRFELPFLQNWRQKFGVGVRYYTIDPRSNASAYILKEEGSEFSNYVSYTIYRNTKTPFLMPRRGTYTELGVTYAPEFLGTYMDWIRGDANFTYYIPVTSRTTFKMNFEVNAIWSLDDEYREGTNDQVLNLRIFDRLFAGGQNDIRGFKRREVGPQDPANDDEYLGGSFRFVANFEYIWRAHDNFAFSVFSDMGNIWETTSDVDGDINVSVGVGVLITTPGLPLRLDYAFPIHTCHDHLENGKGRFHFSMSTTF